MRAPSVVSKPKRARVQLAIAGVLDPPAVSSAIDTYKAIAQRIYGRMKVELAWR
ncbi:MAG: hypothetical protein ACREQO_27455 [Candidatus Binatia bacterium]